MAIIEWKSGRSRLPPTWKSLLSVLKHLNLEELCQQIEDYLICGESGFIFDFFFGLLYFIDFNYYYFGGGGGGGGVCNCPS